MTSATEREAAGRTPERETVAALAAQVADLRGKVLQFEAAHSRAAGLRDLPAQVAALAKTLEDALSDDGALRPLAPYWLDLTEAEYESELAALGQWAGQVLQANYPGYVGQEIKPCWPAHLEAVWELSTLRAEWRRVYDRQKPELAGALAWHDRWLPGVLARLGRVMQSCTAGGCRLDRHHGPPGR
jgi:hypothetical protein